MDSTVTMSLKEYDKLRDEYARLKALEDNLTDFILDELNKEVIRIEDGESKKEWFTISSIYIKELCQRIGYSPLFDNKYEEMKAIKNEDCNV
ncbi:MAG: hypothetical protein Q4A15_03705 [Prevotellaceae bacterium]|nr:hypothetical protein [Prevotellaceae bacterium]